VALAGIYLVNRGFARQATTRQIDFHPAVTRARADSGENVRDGDGMEVRAR
jgi:hypothetical protein